MREPAQPKGGTAPAWSRYDHEDEAVERLLDAAGAVFAEAGLDRTRMEDIARRAGCSRGTVYRYFGSRESVQRAYVDRETRRIGARVAERVSGIEDPGNLLVTALVTALQEVRAEPTLQAWFRAEALGITTGLASSSAEITELVAAFLDEVLTRASRAQRQRPDLDRAGATEWVVRVMLSLLSVEFTPRTSQQEARYLRAFLLPALVGDGTGPHAPARRRRTSASS